MKMCNKCSIRLIKASYCEIIPILYISEFSRFSDLSQSVNRYSKALRTHIYNQPDQTFEYPLEFAYEVNSSVFLLAFSLPVKIVNFETW